MLVRSKHILIGRFGALPWPTSLDAAMKIRGKLFYGRTAERRGRLEPSLELRRQQDVVSLLEADLIQKCFQESVAMLFDRICRLRLAGTGVEPEHCEAACTLAAFF